MVVVVLVVDVSIGGQFVAVLDILQPINWIPGFKHQAIGRSKYE